MRETTKSPNRRSLTNGEKEALRLKKLRDKFGSGPIDPDEPNVPEGMPRQAMRCAFHDARQIHSRPRKRFSPKTLAIRTADIVGLSVEQRQELQSWLGWLNDRRYVTRDPYQSPILMWALSNGGSDIWDGDPEAVWRDRVMREHAARKSATAAATADVPQRRDEKPSDLAISGSSANALSQDRPVASPDVADAPEKFNRPSEDAGGQIAVPLVRPGLPFGAFKKGTLLANKFFGALRDGSDEDLNRAATLLSADSKAVLEIVARGPEHHKCIETVFSHFDLPLPESIR